MELSESEMALISGFPDCPVERLFGQLNEFDGSESDLETLYDLLKWIQNHEGELAKLRRVVEKKIIDQRFKDVKV